MANTWRGAGTGLRRSALDERPGAGGDGPRRSRRTRPSRRRRPSGRGRSGRRRPWRRRRSRRRGRARRGRCWLAIFTRCSLSMVVAEVGEQRRRRRRPTAPCRRGGSRVVAARRRRRARRTSGRRRGRVGERATTRPPIGVEPAVVPGRADGVSVDGDEAPAGAVDVVEPAAVDGALDEERAGVRRVGWMSPPVMPGSRARRRSDRPRRPWPRRARRPRRVGDADDLAELHREVDRRGARSAAAPAW